MVDDFFSNQEKAAQSVINLIAAIRECKSVHDNAGLGYPDILARIVAPHNALPSRVEEGMNETRPDGVGVDWVWIKVREAYSTTLALAVLRILGSPSPPNQLTAKVTEMRPDLSTGSIYNLGVRLEGKSITRSNEGWSLIDESKAPVLDGDTIWSPQESLSSHEIAAIRRRAIKELLTEYSAGLEAVQILERLLKHTSLKAPVNKDLVKSDLEKMFSEGDIRRRGNTRKWELTGRNPEN